MGFERQSNISNKKTNKRSSNRSSNPGDNDPDDGHNDFMAMHREYPTISNVRSDMHMDTSRNKEVVFKRNMTHKKVLLELFIIEGLDYFESKCLRSKMTEVIKLCSEDLKMSYYEKGVSGELPETWDDFKAFIVEFCTDVGIESVKKIYR
jgi:hypothetical protein